MSYTEEDDIRDDYSTFSERTTISKSGDENDDEHLYKQADENDDELIFQENIRRNSGFIIETSDSEIDLPCQNIEIPQWLTETKPVCSPYHPQIGDYIVYIKEGHLAFKEKTKNVFPIIVDDDLPEIFCGKVLEIVYNCGNIITCTITTSIFSHLEIDMNENQEDYPQTSLTVFDYKDALDFIILFQDFEISKTRTFNIYQNVFCRFPDGEYQAQIININNQNQYWEKYCVVFDDSEDIYHLSPWEMRPENGEFAKHPVIDSFRINKLISLFQNFLDDSELDFFTRPVDLKKYPTYLDYVAYPIDINLILNRLKNGFYRRLEVFF